MINENLSVNDEELLNLLKNIPWKKVNQGFIESLKVSNAFLQEANDALHRIQTSYRENLSLFFATCVLVICSLTLRFGYGAALIGIITLNALFMVYTRIRVSMATSTRDAYMNEFKTCVKQIHMIHKVESENDNT